MISAKRENRYERNNGAPNIVADKGRLGTDTGMRVAGSLTVPLGNLMTVRLANFADE